MASIRIVLLCVVSAIVYGIVHDQVTVRVCIEYFTIGHPPVFPTQDPTLLALGWGVIATWWAGLLIGLPLAVAARAGHRPKRTARSLVRPIVWLLLVMAACALLAGVIGWQVASGGGVVLLGPLAQQVPSDRHVPFLSALWAHSASYVVGAVGGLVVAVRVWRSRARAEA